MYIHLYSYIWLATSALFFLFLINDHIHFFFAHFQYDKMPTSWLESTFIICIIERMHVVKLKNAI